MNIWGCCVVLCRLLFFSCFSFLLVIVLAVLRMSSFGHCTSCPSNVVFWLILWHPQPFIVIKSWRIISSFEYVGLQYQFYWCMKWNTTENYEPFLRSRQIWSCTPYKWQLAVIATDSIYSCKLNYHNDRAKEIIK